MMPSLSPTMTEGNIVRWTVKEGDKVTPGTMLAEIQTDKAVVALETQEDGYVGKILVEAGDKIIKVGDLIALVVNNKEDLAKVGEISIAAPKVAPKVEKKVDAPKATTTTTSHAPQQKSGDERVKVSPLAKSLATEKGVSLSDVVGSGPGGRIIKADVHEFTPRSQSQSSSVDTTSLFTDLPLSPVRKVIAARLLESKTTIPHYYLSVECQVDELIKLRSHLNDGVGKKQGFKLSVNDFIIKAAARALLQVPAVNSSWRDSYIRQYSSADISVAVQTDNGLISPIVFDAQYKGLKDISLNVKSLAEKAKQGKLQPNEFQGGTFTISNLGMFGIKEFSAIINPPQAAILAVGTTYNVPVLEGDKLKNTTCLSVTLSCDHRVVDGAVGAQWLQVFKETIEDPRTLLL
jgi:pyruvate dehydrogenase E2 component (dihydrolipoamide acetyltransferase)